MCDEEISTCLHNPKANTLPWNVKNSLRTALFEFLKITKYQIIMYGSSVSNIWMKESSLLFNNQDSDIDLWIVDKNISILDSFIRDFTSFISENALLLYENKKYQNGIILTFFMVV